MCAENLKKKPLLDLEFQYNEKKGSVGTNHHLKLITIIYQP